MQNNIIKESYSLFESFFFNTEWRNIAAAYFLIVCNKADSFRVQMENKKGLLLKWPNFKGRYILLLYLLYKTL